MAENDDRPDDWNFQLTTRLEAGAYDLVLDGVGRGSTTVWMEMPQERDLAPLGPARDRVIHTVVPPRPTPSSTRS